MGVNDGTLGEYREGRVQPRLEIFINRDEGVVWGKGGIAPMVSRFLVVAVAFLLFGAAQDGCEFEVTFRRAADNVWQKVDEAALVQLSDDAQKARW